ncbi:MAG: hypothetical protein WAO02_14795 [Verrucomicrobiia bacterium]
MKIPKKPKRIRRPGAGRKPGQAYRNADASPLQRLGAAHAGSYGERDGEYGRRVSIFASQLAQLCREPSKIYDLRDPCIIAILLQLLKVTNSKDSYFFVELARRFDNPSPLDAPAEPIFFWLCALSEMPLEAQADKVPSMQHHKTADPFSIGQLREFLRAKLPKGTPLPDNRTISRHAKAAGLLIQKPGWPCGN